MVHYIVCNLRYQLKTKSLNYLRFWASPLVILSSSYFIVDHVRQFVGYLITSLIFLLGHSIFLVSLLL